MGLEHSVGEPHQVQLGRTPSFRLGALEVDPATRQVIRGRRSETIEPRVMQVLTVLAQANGAVLTRDELIAACWSGMVVGDNAIHRTISRLRELAEVFGADTFRIETIARVGYRLTHVATPGMARTPWADAVTQKPFVGVLPFRNLSGDPQQDYFADGMTEEIITALSRFRELRTAPRSSTFAFKGDTDNVAEIGRVLRVHYVLTGSVRKADQCIRVTAELTHCANGAQVWRERYDRDLRDIFELQDEVSRNVAAVMLPALQIAEVERVKRKSPNDLTAYDVYLRALPHMWAATREEIPIAIVLLRQSLQHDNTDVAAQCALSWSLILAGPLGAAPPEETFAEALRHARQAIELDDTNAFAQAVYSIALASVSSEYDQVVLHAEDAIRLNPGSTFAWGALGMANHFAGRFGSALEHLDVAVKLSPSDSFAYMWLTFAAAASFALERYADGIDAARKAIQRNPNFGTPHRLLAANLALTQRLDLARDVTRRRDAVQQTSLRDLRAMRLFRQEAVVERYLAAQRLCGVAE